MNRRSFLQAGIATATVVAGFGYSSQQLRCFARSASAKKIPIALQLYSVREAAKEDLSAVLQKVAELGYQGVEFAGYYGKDPKEIRKMLDDLGLKAAGTHTGIGALEGDFNMQADLHKTLGCKFMIVPGGIDKQLHDVSENAKMADRFNKLAEKAKAVNLVVGYHAHGGDAKLIDGIPAWERLFSKTTPDVIAQMDMGNYLKGGGDPYEQIKKFPGRAKSVHLKEASKDNKAPVGEGEIDWQKTFEICETVGGTEWYVVEYEVTPKDFGGVEACIENLRKMGKLPEPQEEQVSPGIRQRQQGGLLKRLLRRR